MMSRTGYSVSGLAVLALMMAGSEGHAFAVKDQSRLPGLEVPGDPGANQPLGPLGPLAPGNEEEQAVPPPAENPESEQGSPVIQPEVIATVEQVTLSEDSTKRAMEAFIVLKTKYQDTDIAEYETLEQFVAEAKEGAALEADVKGHGFASVTEWNNTIMSVSFAYAAVVGTQDQDIRTEIDSIRKDEGLDEELRKSLIASLESMLPSDSNKDVVRKLNEDPAWAEKLKLLVEEEQGGTEQ